MPGHHGANCNCKDEVLRPGTEYLLPYICRDGISALNEENRDSARHLFRSFETRLDESMACRSCNDEDPELIIHVPFTTPCKITSLHIIGGDRGKCPKVLQLYTNNEHLDFSTIETTPPLQKIDIIEDFCGVLEYPLKGTKFNNVTHLTLHFTEPYMGDTLELFFIGLRGIVTGSKRRPVVTVYESRSNLKDHKTPDDNMMNFIGPNV